MAREEASSIIPPKGNDPMIEIRQESPADARAIRAVQETSYPTPAEARLVDALRTAGRLTLSLVAEVDGEVVGHVGFSPVTAGPASGIGLAPVAVLPAHRRSGVAHRLIREGLAASDRLGIGFVVVLGDPGYYQRFGFRAASEWGLSDEYGGGEAFQALELRPGTIPTGAGLVRYAPEFAPFADESA